MKVVDKICSLKLALYVCPDFIDMSNEDKLIMLLGTRDVDILNTVCNYVKHGHKSRL